DQRADLLAERDAARGGRRVRLVVGVDEDRHDRQPVALEIAPMDEGIGVALGLARGQRADRGDVEILFGEALDQVLRQSGMDRIVDVGAVFFAALLRATVPVVGGQVGARLGVGNGFAVIDRDRGIVLRREQFVLVVADDDQRVEIGAADFVAHMVHRGLGLVPAFRDGVGLDQRRGFVGELGDELVVGNQVAVEIVMG